MIKEIATTKKPDSVMILEGIRDSYTGQVKTWIDFMQRTGEGINEEGIKNYYIWLNTESGYKANSILIKRAGVKKRVRQLYKNGKAEDKIKIEEVLHDLDHEHETAPPKINTREITVDKILDVPSYEKLLTFCRSRRQRLFIQFLFYTGARISELTNIKLTDCEVLEETVKIRIIGKGKKERFIRIPLDLYNDILETFRGRVFFMETTRGNKYNRNYISGQIHKIGLRIGRKISAHTLRHSFATRKVNQLPGKIDAISRYLGHSSISLTLDLYTHSQLTDDDLFQEVG